MKPRKQSPRFMRIMAIMCAITSILSFIAAFVNASVWSLLAGIGFFAFTIVWIVRYFNAKEDDDKNKH